MIDTAPQTRASARAWPLTREAWDELIDEIARLRKELSGLTGQGPDDGLATLPMTLTSRRLQTLMGVQERAELVDGGPAAAIGHRVTLRDDDGERLSYRIVFPGDGDPENGCISANSPLGLALLGAKPGDSIDVPAPAGRWSVSVVAVDRDA